MRNENEVAEKINQTIEMFGLTRFVSHMDEGWPTYDQK
jgi:hypothetical protein